MQFSSSLPLLTLCCISGHIIATCWSAWFSAISPQLNLSALSSGGTSCTDPGLPLHSDSPADCGRQWRLCSCHTVQGTAKIMNQSLQHQPVTSLEPEPAGHHSPLPCYDTHTEKCIACRRGVDVTFVTNWVIKVAGVKDCRKKMKTLSAAAYNLHTLSQSSSRPASFSLKQLE